MYTVKWIVLNLCLYYFGIRPHKANFWVIQAIMMVGSELI